MKTNARGMSRIVLFFLLIAVASAAEAGEAWYLRLETDAYERLAGSHRISAAEAASVNAYRFAYDAAGRLVEVEYRRSGRSLADPRYGVPRIEIAYEDGYVLRRFTDSRNVPVPDDRGVWAHRIRLDAAGWAVGVFHYDRYGNVIADKDGVALRLWELDKSGRRSVERFFDVSGARIEDGRGVAEIRYEWNADDRLAGLSYRNLEGSPCVASDEGVHGYRRSYDSDGDAIREVRIGLDGAPATASDGSGMVEWDRDSRGLPVEERRYDPEGSPAPDAGGVAVYRREYDAPGNLVRQEHYGPDGRPSTDMAGVAAYAWIHHPQGNELEQLNLDENGELTEDDAGMASYRWEYDRRGLIVASTSFGTDDRPKGDLWGIARYRYAYDESRNLVEASGYGDWETPAEDSSGVAVYRWDYDGSGNRVMERHFDASGSFAEDSQGIAEYRWTYDGEGRRREQRQFGLYGQLRADPEGVAIYAWNYDGFGRVTERRHYGIDERPVDDAGGAALARWSYGEDGRPLAVARFDRRTLPTD